MDLELWLRGLSWGGCGAGPSRQAVEPEGFRRRFGEANGRYWYGEQESIFQRFCLPIWIECGMVGIGATPGEFVRERRVPENLVISSKNDFIF